MSEIDHLTNHNHDGGITSITFLMSIKITSANYNSQHYNLHLGR